jgi:hypothetical protein
MDDEGGKTRKPGADLVESKNNVWRSYVTGVSHVNSARSKHSFYQLLKFY